MGSYALGTIPFELIRELFWTFAGNISAKVSVDSGVAGPLCSLQTELAKSAAAPATGLQFFRAGRGICERITDDPFQRSRSDYSVRKSMGLPMPFNNDPDCHTFFTAET
jgi:hypothetical protein